MNKSKSRSKSRSRESKRQELEVNILVVMAIAAAISVGIYLLLIPFRETFIGTLLYDRGFTQYLVIILSSIVVATTILKLVLLNPEYRALNKIWIADHIPLKQPKAPEVVYLQERLAAEGSLVAKRCSRVLKSYIKSEDRDTANEFALDDSSFYQSASESSFSVPRILVWAIPLLGFIGTVVGISQAVNNFSGVLGTAGDVEQIKEGIGGVTTGLAVAFDTTLLALFLSVVVMIPLVLVERYESRLLLGIDIFINDKLLPRLKDKSAGMSNEAINQAVKGAIDEHFPDPQALVEPAQDYAQQAAKSLSQGFLAEISKVKDINSSVISQVQDVSSNVINQVDEVRRSADQDRRDFLQFFTEQKQISQETLGTIRALVSDIQSNNSNFSDGLSLQARQITDQLEQAASLLEGRITTLEVSANKLNDFKKWQSSLDDTVRSLEKTAKLSTVLDDLSGNLAELKPVLTNLNKPRKITLVEQDNANGSM